MVPEEQRKAIREGSIAYIKKYQKMGKCKEVYMDADMMGSASIWVWDEKTDSEEYVSKAVLENPMLPFMNMEIRPIIGWDAAVKAQKAALKKKTK
jgi:hypothetical protein